MSCKLPVSLFLGGPKALSLIHYCIDRHGTRSGKRISATIAKRVLRSCVVSWKEGRIQRSTLYPSAALFFHMRRQQLQQTAFFWLCSLLTLRPFLKERLPCSSYLFLSLVIAVFAKFTFLVYNSMFYLSFNFKCLIKSLLAETDVLLLFLSVMQKKKTFWNADSIWFECISFYFSWRVIFLKARETVQHHIGFITATQVKIWIQKFSVWILQNIRHANQLSSLINLEKPACLNNYASCPSKFSNVLFDLFLTFYINALNWITVAPSSSAGWKLTLLTVGLSRRSAVQLAV